MNAPNNERPPLKNIDRAGSYALKLIRPKDESRFKKNARGFASVSLFFLDNDGNCLTKNFSVEYGKGLAMVIGKFSGAYAVTPSDQMSVEQLIRYCEPAFGKVATVELEVTANGEWQGKPQYRYSFKKITPRDPKVYGAPASPASSEPAAEASPAADPFPPGQDVPF